MCYKLTSFLNYNTPPFDYFDGSTSTLYMFLFSQAVLDITYFEENQLVDEDFPEESSLQKLKELIYILSEPEDLVRECSINEEVSSQKANYFII